jgi:hypothetical protein
LSRYAPIFISLKNGIFILGSFQKSVEHLADPGAAGDVPDYNRRDAGGAN